MAVLLKSDVDITDLSATEEEGVMRSVTRKFLVGDLTPTGLPTPIDQAFACTGVPQYGERLPGNTNLACHRREYRVVQDSPSMAYVICEYKTVADWANSFIFSVGSSLNQIQTDVDRFGNKVTLEYTYPAGYPDEKLRGQVYTTRMNETVTVPHMTLTATGSLFVEYPNEIAFLWLNKLNDTFWAGAPRGYWMCTACNARGRDIGLGRAHLWEFDWTFEFNPKGWPLVAKVIDPNTGNVPDDAVDGVGIIDVDWYQYLDFNILFGNT